MHKIKTLIMRVQTMSFKRMFGYAALAAKESGRWRVVILIDMVLCLIKYGTGYLDYHTFGFAHLRDDATRRSFMTMNHNLAYIRRLNDPEKRESFENKLLFNKVFNEYIGRSFIDLESCSDEEFAEFCNGKSRIFVKVLDSFGGLGVKAVDIKAGTDLSALLAELRENHFKLGEEAIRQHEGMNALCRDSVNTVRMVTLIDGEGEVHLMYALLRMGMGGSAVDNISSGGMYSGLDENGVIVAPAYCDKTGLTYPVHPASGTAIEGFRVPLFEEAKELVKAAALRIPEVRYVGWDVAISENGPILVEGNTIPGYDMCQNYRHNVSKQGILPKFQKVLRS